MSEADPRLDSLRRSIEQTESDLRALGYTVERSVMNPGAILSNQIFDEKTMIIVLFGRIRVTSNEQTEVLGPGDRLEVPSGVPYALQVEGETAAYWLHALLKDLQEPSESEPNDSG